VLIVHVDKCDFNSKTNYRQYMMGAGWKRLRGYLSFLEGGALPLNFIHFFYILRDLITIVHLFFVVGGLKWLNQ